jgi:hypothetical protein
MGEDELGVNVNIGAGVRRMAEQNAGAPGAGVYRVALGSEGDRTSVSSRLRPRQRPLRHPPAGSIGKMLALGVTLAALILLVGLLAWPLVAWLLALAGINLSSLCT